MHSLDELERKLTEHKLEYLGLQDTPPSKANEVASTLFQEKQAMIGTIRIALQKLL